MAKHAQTQTGTGSDRLSRRILSRLVLTGFMGAGKSTVGPLLAESLGWRFLDLDSVIEAAHGKTVPEIFRDEGETVFREYERQALDGLRYDHRIVLALGGGSLEHPDALPSLLQEESTCLVFLDAPLPELLARIREKDAGVADPPRPDAQRPQSGQLGLSETEEIAPQSSRARPLLANPDQLEARHRRRLPGYRSAHITVLTSGMRPHEVAKRILTEVRREWWIGREATEEHDQLP